MASHTEIAVGSTDWVVRIGGADVKVKILEKVKKSSGRGYEFRVKRVDHNGRAVGRPLTRGSGSFRRPGEPAKAFGGKSPVGFKKNPPAASTARAKPRKRPAKKSTSTGSRRSARSSVSSGASVAVPSLPSLRGRKRTRASAPSPRRASAPSEPVPAKPEYPSDLARDICEAVKRTSGTEREVRNAFADVMAKHRTNFYHGF